MLKMGLTLSVKFVLVVVLQTMFYHILIGYVTQFFLKILSYPYRILQKQIYKIHMYPSIFFKNIRNIAN